MRGLSLRTFAAMAAIAGLFTFTPMMGAERTDAYSVSELDKAPQIDGDLSDWPGIEKIFMYDKRLNDLRADVRIGWNKDKLFIQADVVDGHLVNDNEPNKIQNADALVFQVCTNEEKQGVKAGEYDFTLVISPTSASGKPACRFTNKAKGIDVVNPAKGDASGIEWQVNTEKGWKVEAAIPFKLLGYSPQAGAKLPFIVVIYDRDKKDKDEWKQFHKRVQTFSKKKPLNLRPNLVLAKGLVKPEKKAAKAKPQKTSSNAGLAVSHHEPCNMFWQGENVSFEGSLKAPVSGTGKVTVKLLDYNKACVAEKKVEGTFEKNQQIPLPLDFGKLDNGYYALMVGWDLKDADGNKAVGSKMACSLGVAPQVSHTAKQVRDDGYRIGLKMWYLRDAWWRGHADFRETEAVDATCKLGLQWTRAQMQQTAHLATVDLMKNYPMNVIMKVESFPKELFDTERYGPMDEWIKKNDRAWMKKTVPQEKGYKEYLRNVLKTIPKDQKVFEIWNEAWDKMTAEDLAQISNWVAEVILEERPDAIIGPNLMGRMSKYGYDAKYIEAGGMKGMKMVALHPYAGSENRDWLRDYQKWLKELTGRDIAIYVTEYGSHSCPEGPSKRSEEEQARRVVRQTFALYAEGVKAMTPHWMGQREENRTYHEHWFGFYRLNHQPKPVLLALANCARMIDGKNYVGDLWYGPGVGAMLFEKDDKYTMALWTKDGSKEIVVEPGVNEVEIVDMIGRSKRMKVENGRLPLTVGLDAVYINGVSPKLKQVASTELKPERWPQPPKAKRNVRVAKKVTPKIDGDFSDWKDKTQLELVNAKVNGQDASGIGYLGWDEKNLYVGINMRDNQVMNRQTPGLLYKDDSLELFISTEPREINPGYGPNDHQYFIAPTSKDGKVVVGEIVNRESHEIAPIKGSKYHVDKSREGWVTELAIPWTALGGFKNRLALELRVNDSDSSHERWKIDPTDAGKIRPSNPELWSILELKD